MTTAVPVLPVAGGASLDLAADREEEEDHLPQEMASRRLIRGLLREGLSRCKNPPTTEGPALAPRLSRLPDAPLRGVRGVVR